MPQNHSITPCAKCLGTFSILLFRCHLGQLSNQRLGFFCTTKWVPGRRLIRPSTPTWESRGKRKSSCWKDWKADSFLAPRFWTIHPFHRPPMAATFASGHTKLPLKPITVNLMIIHHSPKKSGNLMKSSEIHEDLNPSKMWVPKAYRQRWIPFTLTNSDAAWQQVRQDARLVDIPAMQEPRGQNPQCFNMFPASHPRLEKISWTKGSSSNMVGVHTRR